MAEGVAGAEQVDRPAAIGDLHGSGPHHVQVIKRLRAGGHDHRARGEVLHLDLAGQPGQVIPAERVEGRLGAEEVGELLHLFSAMNEPG